MPDLMQHLQAARPTDDELDRMWPSEQRDRALDGILASDASQHPGRPGDGRGSRRRTAWLAAAATIPAVALVPVVLDSGEAAAQADLEHLAQVAAGSGGPLIAEGTYLHVTTEAVQRNSRIFGDGRTLDTFREQWVRWDGKTWAIDSRPSAGWQEYFVFPRQAEPAANQPTPEFAASLPDEPEALRAYLEEHVSGSSSHEEALFDAVSDLVHSHFLPPETLSAALGALADVDGVSTEDVVVDGRPAVEITYSHWLGLLGRHSITVDRETAQVVSERSLDPGGSYELTTTLVEVVDDIPADVREDFERHEGERVHD